MGSKPKRRVFEIFFTCHDASSAGAPWTCGHGVRASVRSSMQVELARVSVFRSDRLVRHDFCNYAFTVVAHGGCGFFEGHHLSHHLCKTKNEITPLIGLYGIRGAKLSNSPNLLHVTCFIVCHCGRKLDASYFH
ncbi:hypothetical protein PIB30_005792 [Stylosanthes scabra]|uniref:Uncharacterized protein n=1 Tax=Stylosanthes scabra TaxID=79078 RepID=A0ABU6X1G9_9FABA|nr:hypothetical protein [Stylosanthes scabra]